MNWYDRLNDAMGRALFGPEGSEQKGIAFPEPGASNYIYVPPLVHGPGAPPWGQGNERGDGNSAVFACLEAFALAFIEPPARVMVETETNEFEAVPNHPWQRLLDSPNPHMQGHDVWHWIAWCLRGDGNAYLRKVRSGDETRGNVVELWPVSPLLMRPERERGSDQFIDYYRYDYAPGKWERVPPENVIHLKVGMDDRDHRLGMAPLKRLIRDIASDEEASRWQEAMLSNGGAAGMMVHVPKDSTLDPAQALLLKEKIRADFSGDNRGAVGILLGGAEAKPYGFSPEQMNLKALHEIPEARIAAVVGVPPAVAGLTIGLEQTSNYASMREVREMFTESRLMPTWHLVASTITHSLRQDMPSERAVIRFDTSRVRALQEDESALYERMRIAVEAGFATPNTAAGRVGLPPVTDGDVVRGSQPAQLPPADDDAAKMRRLIHEVKAQKPEALPELMQALVDLAAPAFTEDIERYQDDQRKRIKRRMLGAG